MFRIIIVVYLCLQDIDWQAIEARIRELDERTLSSKSVKRKNSTLGVFEQFLQKSNLDLMSCRPEDVRKFLVWKDSFGKTTVHDVRCRYLGKQGVFECPCPKRLSSATVENIISQITNIFEDAGLGRNWDILLRSGNPACAPLVKEYLKLMKEEQAKAHILPKQAKPIFLTKVKSIVSFIRRELMSRQSVKEKFIFYRDQAWFKLQFFAGDRATDLSLVVSQEVKLLNDESGIVFRHTFGKTLRGDKGKNNTFVIKKCEDVEICPVIGLLEYVQFCKSNGVDLSTGYLFRIRTEVGKVLDQPVNYSVMYERLRYYLTTLGLYDGETPHSFRAGCAVTMALSNSADNVDQAMEHIGWFGKASAEYYSRINTLVDSSIVAENLAKSADKAEKYEDEFRDKADYSGLKNLI